MQTILEIPSMNRDAVNAELEHVGKSYTGRGVIVECGTWLGASLLRMSNGVGEREATFHCFDNFSANASEVEKARTQGVCIELGDTRSWVEQNALPLLPKHHDVTLHQGRLRDASWFGPMIEIFVLDAGKRNPTFKHIIKTFRSFWLADVKLCLLDAYYKSERSAFHDQLDFLESNHIEHRRIGSAAFA